MADEENFALARLEKLQVDAKDFCNDIGLHETFLKDLFNETDCWAFIIKTDTLLETACRYLVANSLYFKLPRKDSVESSPKKFIQKLPYEGRSSIIQLLKEANCPEDHIQFITAVRMIRTP